MESMNLNSPCGFARVACFLGLGFIAVFGFAGCADTYATAPVYRGAYYAYDAYPYGYRGYPGYPYYGAPFGNNAAMVRAEHSSYVERRGDDGSRRNHRQNSPRRSRERASGAHRSDEQTSRAQ